MKHWDRPTGVVLDGQPWMHLDSTPGRWRDCGGGLDLTKAWIVKRHGRDTVALEHTPDSFDLHIADSPNESSHYAITIAISRIGPATDE